MSLRLYTVRAMRERPGRTILTLLSIIIGVAAAVAIDLGTDATRATYQKMFATVTGRATLEITAAGGVAFDDEVLAQVEATPGVLAAAPIVEKPSALLLGERQVRLQVMGIDPTRDGAVREYDIVAGRQLVSGDELVLDEEFAKLLAIQVGDEVGLRTGRRRPFQVVGLLKPRGAEVLRQASLVFMPIDRAQFWFYPRGRTKKHDKIQIVTAAGDAAIERVRTALARQLATASPAAGAASSEEPLLMVSRPSGSTQLMEHTLRSSEIGLTLASAFSLLLAAFIILNTLLMNVGERRRHLAIMRAIGATRWQLVRALVGESLLLGAIGTALGMAIGLGAAWISNGVLMSALDVTLPSIGEVLSLKPFLLGAFFGLVMCLLGVLIPALRVSKVSPLEGMSRVAARDLQNWSWPFFWLGTSLMVVGAAIIAAGMIGWLPISAPLYGGLLFLGGIVALQTVLLRPLASLVALVFRPFRPVEASLALKQILRHNTRSALTVGVLFIAGATGVGLANSILDNVRDVHDWVQAAIVGDYFIRAMMPDMATGTVPDLPDSMHEELLRVDPQHVTIDGASYLEARLTHPGPDGQPQEVKAICIARQFVNSGPGEPPPFDLIEGNLYALHEQLAAGDVVLGSVLAQQLKVKTGDTVQLETVSGQEPVKVAAIANEYLVGGMAIHMHRRWAIERLGVQGFDAFVVRVNGIPKEAVRPQLEAICQKYDVILKSYADISGLVASIVDGIEWSLWLLVYLGFVVAAFGVVNTLTMNVLEQTRELGLLRIVAMTKAQVRRTIVTQALIIGGVGLPPGIALGVLNAYVMNLGMMSSFGHPIEFHIHPELLVVTCLGSLLIVLVAAIIPAYRATRIDVVEALHYE
jgi:putative ABC transport system permease protein